MTESGQTDCDVLIVGGGLVGSLLANALSGLSLDIVMVEARRVDTLSQPSFDGRATALANGSQRVLAGLGLWDAISGDAQPIRHIHIGERGHFGSARISASEEGVPALGFTVENRLLGKAFWEPLDSDGRFRCFAPAEVSEFSCADDCVEASIESADAVSRIRARLLVAADGAGSRLRSSLGIEARVDDYEQCAIIVNCTTSERHCARAFERFTPDGPLAVLPLTRDRVAVVWTLPAHVAKDVLNLPENEFRRALQRAFGFRLGYFERIGRRDIHELRRVLSRDVVGDRAVLIGNAAVALHPVAGQGFNLALRDAASLAEVIADAAGGDDFDPGDRLLLDRYRSWRAADQQKLAGFTHGLVRGFGTRAPGLPAVRALSLMAFDLLPGAKSLLARHTMGLAGRVPRLARGLSLS